MNSSEGCELTSQVAAYYNAIVTENHLRFVIGRHTACKRLINVNKFRVHYLLGRMSLPPISGL